MCCTKKYPLPLGRFFGSTTPSAPPPPLLAFPPLLGNSSVTLEKWGRASLENQLFTKKRKYGLIMTLQPLPPSTLEFSNMELKTFFV